MFWKMFKETPEMLKKKKTLEYNKDEHRGEQKLMEMGESGSPSIRLLG